jgi:protein-S-isoprenylcysteine O-methyltransferase Ste14
MKTSYLVKQFVGTFIFFAILFISAGRLDYWQGLIYVCIGFVMFVLGQTVLQIDEDLTRERSKPGQDTKQWDKAILGLSLLFTISMYVVAGLDSGRFHWSGDFHLTVVISGVILTASGQLIFLIAQKQNRFFSSTARIQTERGHTVCDTGLYRIVRHPAYMGTIIQSLGFPMLFESYWSIIPVGLLVILFIIRTILEDSMLRSELQGYPEYAQKTPFKLIPGIW